MFILCCFVFFCVVFVFYFIKISKFALPGVMLMYERTSIDRKKENVLPVDEEHHDTFLAMLISQHQRGWWVKPWIEWLQLFGQ